MSNDAETEDPRDVLQEIAVQMTEAAGRFAAGELNAADYQAIYTTLAERRDTAAAALAELVDADGLLLGSTAHRDRCRAASAAATASEAVDQAAAACLTAGAPDAARALNDVADVLADLCNCLGQPYTQMDLIEVVARLRGQAPDLPVEFRTAVPIETQRGMARAQRNNPGLPGLPDLA